MSEELSQKDALKFHDALADVLCFLAGFSAAIPDDCSKLDCINFKNLRELKRLLNKKAYQVKDAK